MTSFPLRWGGPAGAGPPLIASDDRPLQSTSPRLAPARVAPAVTATVLPRVAAGEARAVEECLDRYGGLVWSLARRYCGPTVDAEDAVQEVFVALWKNADRFDERVASEATFVTMISRRRLIDMLRRRRSPESGAGSEPVEEVVAPPPPPGLELTEEVERVRGFMKQLTEEQRRVLDLAICEGLSQSTIAEITGWPLGTVKSHARRGMQRLRKLVGDDQAMEGAL